MRDPSRRELPLCFFEGRQIRNSDQDHIGYAFDFVEGSADAANGVIGLNNLMLNGNVLADENEQVGIDTRCPQSPSG